MKKHVPISVVIPVFNGEKFIGAALESVAAQTFEVEEIIVVDNNCTDRTREIAEKFGAKIVQEEKQILAAARNRGIETALCDWIAFLDADDWWHERKIEFQWRAIEKFPEARFISCDCAAAFDPEKAKSAVFENKEIAEGVYPNTFFDGTFAFSPSYTLDLLTLFIIHSSTFLCHRKTFERAGNFDESFSYAEDFEFFQRALAAAGAVATVKKTLALIRRHETNMSLNTEKLNGYKIRAIEQMLEFPERYTPGAGVYFLAAFKKSFVRKGKTLKESSDKMENF